MTNFGISKIAVALLAIGAAGCAAQGGTPAAGPPLSSATRQQSSPVSPMHAPGKRGPLAGKYHGSISTTIGNHVSPADLDVNLRFHKMNVLTPFNITANGQTVKYRFGGWCTSKGNGQAQMVFILYNTKGGYATGSASIVNGVFSGHAKTPAGAVPAKSFTFSTAQQ